jgi:cellulose synthase/poly-beta-1,6-N-acetylglucosamine synthase-like glycosyltransferase
MKLSIIVCAYNEEKSIGLLLKNLQGQRLPPEITDRELIIVASGCTDKTVSKIEESMNTNVRITLIQEETRRGKASALNKAFQAASGDYLALVPADVEPADNALFNLLTPFRKTDVAAVSGNPTVNPRRTPTSFAGSMAQTTYRLWTRLMRKLNASDQMAHCSGELMAIRSNVKATIPNDCAADDSYIAINAKKKGKIRFAADAVCYNLLPSNITDYINQRRRWLYGHFQTKQATGAYPTVIDTIILSKPSIALQVLTEEISQQPRHLHHLAGATIIEAAVYLLSTIDRIRHRRLGVWPTIKSTKYN